MLPLLIVLGVLFVWDWFKWDGYLIARVFLTITLLIAFLNPLFAACTHRHLLVRPWQISVGTAALLLLAWPKPEHVYYSERVAHLRIGMSVREVQDTMAPHPIALGRYYCDGTTLAKVAAARVVLRPGFTGTVVCNDKIGYGDGNIVILSFKQGTLSDVNPDPYD